MKKQRHKITKQSHQPAKFYIYCSSKKKKKFYIYLSEQYMLKGNIYFAIFLQLVEMVNYD